MSYIKNKDIKSQHIHKLVQKCGFVDVTDDPQINVDQYEKVIRTDNDEIMAFPDLIRARDFLVTQLVIREKMASMTDIS